MRPHIMLLFVLLLPFSLRSGALTADAQFISPLIFDPFIVDAHLFENGTTFLVISVTVKNPTLTTVGSFDIRVDSLHIKIMSASLDEQHITPEVDTLEKYSRITVTFSEQLKSNETATLKLLLLAYDLQSELLLDPNQFLQGSFIYYLRPEALIKNFTLRVTLPDYAMLSESTASPLFPDASGNFTDGSRLIFYWNVPSISPGQEQAFIVKYQIPSTQSPSVYSWFFNPIILSGLGLLAGVSITLVVQQISQRIRQTRRVQYIGVDDDELAVLNLLSRKGGSCPQKELYRELDMSQARVSLILSGLEERGLIRRFREGRENIVHLIE